MRKQYVRALMLIFWYSCVALSAAHATEKTNAPERGRSAGCGIAQAGTGRFTPMKISVFGLDRTYHLRLPRTYDPHRGYPLIFRWHGRGGNGLSGGLGIEFSAGEDAIIVGADGLNGTWRHIAAIADLSFFDRMRETLEEQYCIDRDRIFSYGYSSGGYVTNRLACERGDVLRASASVAGGPGGGNCKGKVAAFFLHDSNDQIVPIAKGKAARDLALAVNGCSTKTVDEGNGCVRYQGCESAPVVWCESKGFGHNIRGNFAPARVWRFFQSLP